jgi:ribosomal-protein-alanine N-acetyltransferase
LASNALIRPAASADLSVVASWISTARDCEQWSLPSAIGFSETNSVAVTHRDRLVAFGQLVSKASRRGHLARLIVSPADRGQGYGDLLVRGLLEKARDESFERVSLNVDGANVPAIALYLKQGFLDASRPAGDPASPGSRYMEHARSGLR